MNLYQFHKKPEVVDHHTTAPDHIPILAWDKYKTSDERKAREDLWAKDARYAYFYALDTLKGRFKKGEDIIAKDPGYAYEYAMYILGTGFRKGEYAIANSHLRQAYELIFKVKLPHSAHN